MKHIIPYFIGLTFQIEHLAHQTSSERESDAEQMPDFLDSLYLVDL